jgi:hypothetical protein
MKLIRQAGSSATNEEFVLHCQPKVDLESGEIIGAEALVRWCHPVLGLQSPRAFHPIERRNRLMTVTHVVRLNGRDPLLSELSLAGHKVLGLLQKGSGYHVLGAWRFRGSRSPVKERTIVSLLEKGLAERIETDQHLELRITPLGRSANQKSPCREPNSPSYRPLDYSGAQR